MFVPLTLTPGYEDSRPADADLLAMKTQDERQAQQERLGAHREEEDWLPEETVCTLLFRSESTVVTTVPVDAMVSARARGPPDVSPPESSCEC